MINTTHVRTLAVLAISIALGGMKLDAALGQCEAYENAKLLASDGAADDNFGYSAAIDGDAVVVTATWTDDNGENSGSAYVYRFDGAEWVEEAELHPSDGAAQDWFGWYVDIWDDTVVVGVGRDDDHGENSGSVYVFRYDGATWIEEAKLLASDGAAHDVFGKAVVVEGDVIIVGAPDDGDNGDYSGSAYVFQFNGSEWVEEAKLLPSDGKEDDHFGWDVAVHGDTAVITAAFGSNDDGSRGSAYVFRFDGSEWVEEAELLASDSAAEGGFFGESVALWEDIALIGTPRGDGNGEDSGSAYVFRYDGSAWNEEVKLVPSDGAAGANFGSDAAVQDDTILIGAWLANHSGEESGSAYAFRFDGATWVEQAKLVPSDSAAGDQYGWPLDLDGDIAVIGAWLDDDMGEDSGSAYMFRGLSDCNSNDVLDACEPDFDSDGLIDACDPDIDDDGVPNAQDACDFTPVATPVDAEGRSLGDIDKDCDTDLHDFSLFQQGFTGSQR
jgi:hypothetical protein